MSGASRRARVMEDLERLGSVSVAELVEMHGVSEMTVRRDLAQLEESGLVRRFHGGAVLERPRSFEPPYTWRYNQRREDKQRLAAVIAELIGEGDTIALDYGTTIRAVAEALGDVPNLTIVTPNVHAAMEVVDDPIRVILTGGQLRPSELALVGREAERTFEQYHVDMAIVSAAGVDAAAGLTDFNPEEVAVKRAMIASAKRVIAVADASKLGVVAFASIAGIDAIDLLVTSAAPDDEVARAIEQRGISVRHVVPGTAPAATDPTTGRADNG